MSVAQENQTIKIRGLALQSECLEISLIVMVTYVINIPTSPTSLALIESHLNLEEIRKTRERLELHL